MNYVDAQFQWLIGTLESLSEEETFEKIKNNYKNIDIKIQQSLEDYFSKFNYWGKLKKSSEEFEEIQNRAHSLHTHLKDFQWLYKKLGDFRSKKLLYAIMNNWLQYDFKSLKECQEQTFCDYFDLDLVKADQDTVLIDLGAYTGDTTLNFIKSYQGVYKKIYCYEITDTSFLELQKNLALYQNIECRKKAANDCEEHLFLATSQVDASANMIAQTGEQEIIATSIDHDIPEKITMIKMDIEGYEQKALIGCKKHIAKEHPTLLVSVYHNHEDIWKIPKMIEEICPGYQFYLRYHGGNIFPTEVTLIAIYPKKET